MNKIIFCFDSYKYTSLLERTNETNLNNDKYISFKELINKYYFSYDEKTIAYLIDNYKYNYDKAKLILTNLLAIKEESYSSKKLELLKNIKIELDSKGLLIYDDLFKDYLKRFELFYVDSNIDKFTLKLLNEIGATKIASSNRNYQHNKINVFDNINMEIEYLFQSIAKLLLSGVSPSDIKVLGLSPDYEKEVERLSNIFGIRFNNFNTSFYSYNFVKTYNHLLAANSSFEDALTKLKEIYNPSNIRFTSFYRQLLRNINKVNNLDINFNDKKDMFKALIKKSKRNIRFKYEISSLSLDDLNIKDIDHIFITGLNQNHFPRNYKDEDYLKDSEKELLGLETSFEKTIRQKKELLSLIQNHKEIYMSANLFAEQERKTSSLCEELNLEVILNSEFDEIYNNELGRYKLAKYLDEYIKYDIKDPNLEPYLSSFDIAYRLYDNKFTGIDESFKERIGKKLILSYSSLNTFNHCSFKYYIEKILRLNKYEETFYTKIGNLFHDVLAEIFSSDKDMLVLWDEKQSIFEFSQSEKILLNKLKNEIVFIAEQIKSFHDKSEFKDIITEKEIIIDIDEQTSFKGFIDKIMHANLNGEDLVALADYKTGSSDVKIKNLDYGFDMQLPIYWYLLKRSGLFKNPVFTGMYLQQILFEETIVPNDKNSIDIKTEEIKLSGYSINDSDKILHLDPTAKASQYIKGIKLTKEGALHKVRLLEEADVKTIDEKTAKKINEAKDSIWNAEFEINPKYFSNKLMGCQFCNYRDLCFKTPEDIKYLEERNSDDEVDE